MKNTAVLIFAQTAKKETQSKFFYGGQAVFTQLNAHIQRVVKATKIPFYVCNEHQQVGTTFGERFTNAIQDIYNKGYENVIVVGNDTPQISKTDILYVAQQLQTKKSVVGPSLDGGFYLLGLHKTAFNATKFLQFPWQKKHLLFSLITYFKGLELQTTVLAAYKDLDGISDVSVVLEQLQTTLLKLRNALSATLVYSKKITNTVFFWFANNYHSTAFNKGSPVF